MNPLLEQFLAESRECLQGIGEKLMELEHEPTDTELMTALFRLVHTLKGNSGLFEFHEMTRVLHAGEDLMDAVRNGRIAYSQELADRLLDAMDFVGSLCDEVEGNGEIRAVHAADSARLAESLRQLLARVKHSGAEDIAVPMSPDSATVTALRMSHVLADAPSDVRSAASALLQRGAALQWVEYTPAEESFFQGVDPFHQARHTPEQLWGRIRARNEWPDISALDAYNCALSFDILTSASIDALSEHFRYVPEQIRITQLMDAPPLLTIDASALADHQVVASTGFASAALSDDVRAALDAILDAQRQILALPIEHGWHQGRARASASALGGCARTIGALAALPALDTAISASLAAGSTRTLQAWMTETFTAAPVVTPDPAPQPVLTRDDSAAPSRAEVATSERLLPDTDVRFGRRTEDTAVAPKSLKVDQEKIDRLMNLIGEMVVSKNALPYLANRAETVFGSREMSREIKAQHAVINRIVEEMQDAIMQVRMMPVSFVFQRFPRLVRDTARKLGKDVQLVLEGEETEADKNIIEALSDPLIHIVRNSLDHGLEMPEARRDAGKPAIGTLTIRARQQSDRVIIEIRDDGKGIDPQIVKRKAVEKGLIDAQTAERMGHQEAIQLIFAAGFSTMDVVSDLSGRGVGMDVVRTAIERVNGAVSLESEVGCGTTITLSLPLSMAVTNVMIVESDDRLFGVPMEYVLETVRVPRASLYTIKQTQTMVRRGRILPLKALNALLEMGVSPRTNADDEHAVLVVRVGEESVGLLVDGFRGTSDVILKPMSGVLANLSAYAGSALMGDGTVLMVLNPREII